MKLGLEPIAKLDRFLSKSKNFKAIFKFVRLSCAFPMIMSKYTKRCFEYLIAPYILTLIFLPPYFAYFVLNFNLLSVCSLITSQEIWSSGFGWNDSITIWHGVKHFRRSVVDIREFQDRGYIATTITIIRCTPNCYKLIVEHVLVAQNVKELRSKNLYFWHFTISLFRLKAEPNLLFIRYPCGIKK